MFTLGNNLRSKKSRSTKVFLTPINDILCAGQGVISAPQEAKKKPLWEIPFSLISYEGKIFQKT